MESKLIIAINLANPHVTDPLYLLQKNAFLLNQKRLPSWARTVLCKLACEDLPNWTGDDFNCGTLPRCSCEAGYPRHLPYIRDIMNAAKEHADPQDWIGLANSDIVFTPVFFEKMRVSKSEAVIVHRLVIDETQWRESKALGRTENDCMDAFFVRAETWDRCDVPDFLLGEPHWDPPVMNRLEQFRHEVFENGECLHVKHKGTWRYKFTKNTVHNLKLAMKYCHEKGFEPVPYTKNQWRLIKMAVARQESSKEPA